MSTTVWNAVSKSRTSDEECEHGWRAESRHRVSTGVIVYVVCVNCGTRRVDFASSPDEPPVAVSRGIAGSS